MSHTCKGSGCPIAKSCNLFQEYQKDQVAESDEQKQPVLPNVPYNNGKCDEFVPNK